ncbi:hypothetical protein Back11_08100 [Paenibacillus baekrokdamisoli]|uniref:Uncharacterized protein n=1 Tax=Paenibacillus baekrokdamisoli TaxID=1712516 RepID=A0A3G9ITU1_9BACL|nr:YqzE family protein [Paenibacillus baekrokdamisoli]MBB3067349.1 hypothetical protein [Paenibacillus baekrokdamisoli]BBH19465.1 hypothetical protein Back11_08100 [Paenibacillus baekrokdamisoli]
MAKDSEDYIKYMTGKIVTYIETPQEIRKSQRHIAKAQREPWLTRWFGVGAFGLVLWWRERKERQSERSADLRENTFVD